MDLVIGEHGDVFVVKWLSKTPTNEPTDSWKCGQYQDPQSCMGVKSGTNGMGKIEDLPNSMVCKQE